MFDSPLILIYYKLNFLQKKQQCAMKLQAMFVAPIHSQFYAAAFYKQTIALLGCYCPLSLCSLWRVVALL